MTLARLSLGLTALAFAFFGVCFLVAPTSLVQIGVLLYHPNAVTEIRAFYGGLELGIAAFFFLALARPAWFVPALVLQALALGATAAARLFGILGGGTTRIMLVLAAAEAIGCVVAIVALSRLRSEERPNPRA